MFLVESRAGADGPQGDELPGALPHLRERDAELQGSADSVSRADAAAPERGVRRALGADTRPAVQPGRWALLRDGVADRRRGRAAVAAGPAGLRRLRADVGDEAVDAAGGVPRRDRDVGSRGARAEARARRRRPAVHGSTRGTAHSTDRKSISTSPTRSGGSGSARRFSSITRCRSGST